MNKNNTGILTPELKDVIIGTLLGDAKMTFSPCVARYICEQGEVHKSYLYHLFDLFSAFARKNAPVQYTRLDKRSGKTHVSFHFATLSLPVFREFATMFYVVDSLSSKIIKIVPTNIEVLLTPRALAYWIMDDGTKTRRGGVTLCTDSFTMRDTLRLKRVLETKFGFKCSLHRKKRDSARIYISGNDLDKLSTLVKPFMHESFMYKIMPS